MTIDHDVDHVAGYRLHSTRAENGRPFGVRFGRGCARLVALLALNTVVMGEIHEVDATGSIQNAINRAADGDTIVVGPGTYHETIDFLGKGITVRGDEGSAVTVIDATGIAGSAVRCVSGEWADSVLEGFTVTGGTGTSIGGFRYGGGMLVLFGDPTVRDCTFTHNEADAGGGMSVWGMVRGSITGCRFIENSALTGGSFGGAGMLIKGGEATVIDCEFRGNTAVGTARGGGVRVAIGEHEFTNCLFFDNLARYGGAIANHDSRLTITNCTIVGNTAVAAGGAMRCVYDDAVTTVTNSILWDNSAGDDGEAIHDAADAATTVRTTTMEGGWSGQGEGVIDVDPTFVDLPGGNLRLRPESQVIDAGDNNAVTVDLDLDGNERISDGVVDLGAYESTVPTVTTCDGDLDVDGDIDFEDLLALLAAWGPCVDCPADLDGDKEVAFGDLLLLLVSWGSCPASP